ncbi:hypothetical protein FISHEDRAFT_67789 [Fistulina hepatica ATCC 64428]|nr:hypothetical protein FISHEDRAFT_67789 [Fistulina hepatica ATCC 64428]
MSGNYLDSIAENASRLGMRLQETISERTRDLGKASTLDTSDEQYKNIRKQLDSNSDRDKLDAMRRLIALISKGRNVSDHFAQVVKNVASTNLEIRKLVYIYLLRYAEQEPDLALLSINTFQKDLNDSNALIRAMALRVLSGIKVPMIAAIVVLAIKKCAADMSPYVRKAAALAIPKCFELDSSQQPELINVIATMLADRSPLSIGCVAVAFETVCPTRLDLLHKRYRRLCRILVDVDEWGQVDLMNLLLRYARTMLPRPTSSESGDEIDKDVQLLLDSCEPLFQSQNPAVVFAATRVFFYAGLLSMHTKFVSPVLRLLGFSPEVEYVTLAYILFVARQHPSLFAAHYYCFLVRTTDVRAVKLCKIQLLTVIVTKDTYPAVLREFIDYADDIDDAVVANAIRAIGLCIQTIPESVSQCMPALTAMIKSSHDAVVAGAVLVLKNLIQSQLMSLTAPLMGGTLSSPQAIIFHLARRLDDIHHAQARACVFWMVGQYCESKDGMLEWCPDVLRKAAKSFASEDSAVKLQIITLAAKLFVVAPDNAVLGLLTTYVFSLARYDKDFDVRDRGRMLSTLIAGTVGSYESRVGVVLRREQVKVVLFDGKQAVVEDMRAPQQDANMLGSLALVIGQERGSGFVPSDWLEEGVESSIRDSDDDKPTPAPSVLALSSEQSKYMTRSVPDVLAPPSGSSTPKSTTPATAREQWTDLDKFYAESESEEEEDDEEEEDEENEDGDDESGRVGSPAGDSSSEEEDAGSNGDSGNESENRAETSMMFR